MAIGVREGGGDEAMEDGWARGVRLVPGRAGENFGYWCTWGAQGQTVPKEIPVSAGLAFAGDQGNVAQQDWLTENLMFAEPGWVTRYGERIRGDLWVMLDQGWDQPLGLDMNTGRWRFGCCEPDAGRFPSLTGSQEERLRQMSERVKAAGWRGLGIWIGAQMYGDKRDGATFLPWAEVEAHWRERARRSHKAGVGYWKVDWGMRDGDADFRLALNRIVAEEAPGILVEHAPICGPLNDMPCPWHVFEASGSGRFAKWDGGKILAMARRLLATGDVYRSYDVTTQLSVATTLDRVAALLVGLRPEGGARALLNVEDELYLGAALGCPVGIMRHPLIAAMGKWPDNWTEAERAVRWQRVMPPFGAGAVSTVADEVMLEDAHAFKPGETWATWVIGTTVTQPAPARIARGMALPRVEVAAGEEVPFVVCGRHLEGMAAVATLPRHVADRGEVWPRARVTVELPELDQAVGAFGHYAELVLRAPRKARGARLWMQDLALDEALDVTAEVRVSGAADGGTEVVIPGALIDRVGRMGNHAGDVSGPGVVMRFW